MIIVFKYLELIVEEGLYLVVLFLEGKFKINR